MKSKNQNTKKIVTGVALTVAVLATTFTIGFKLIHKPVTSDIEKITSEESQKLNNSEKDKNKTENINTKTTDNNKAAVNKLNKPNKSDEKDEAKSKAEPTVKPEDKDEEAKPNVKPDIKPQPKPDPVKPTPKPDPIKPTPKPEPVKPTPKPEPSPVIPVIPETPEPIIPDVKPDPKPEEHVHNWVDMYERKAEQIWVVDSPAWDEEIQTAIGSHDVCNGCGCDLSSMDSMSAAEHLAVCGGSYHNEVIYETTIVHHEETGHYETKYNTVVVGRECLTCGKQEYY